MKRILFCTPAVVIALIINALVADAQQPRRTQHPSTVQSTAPDLAAQVAELRASIARLEASIAASQQGSATAAPGSGMQGMGGMKGGMMGRQSSASGVRGGAMGGGMGGGMGKGAAGGMKSGMMDDMGEMSGGKDGMMAGMESMDAGEMSMEMGMMGMGSMGQQGSSAGLRASSLPGFPGASHVYHVGATGFFLDHPDHISLDTTQLQELNRLKQSALLAKASTQRKINEAEQQLWELTAADQPDADQIQAKVEETAKLRGQQRLDFIRAVGEAAKVLTDEQRQILLGLMQPGQQQQAHSHPSK